MKKISIFTEIIFCLIASVISSYGQSSASAAIGATMVTPISIAKNSDMSFGVLASSVTGGTVAMDSSSGNIHPSAGVTAISGTPTTCSFTVTGDGGHSFSIGYSSTSITLSDGSSHLMTLDLTKPNTGSLPTAANLAGTTGTSGTYTWNIGGTLTIPASQVAGSYNNTNTSGSGAFTVTVNYN